MLIEDDPLDEAPEDTTEETIDEKLPLVAQVAPVLESAAPVEIAREADRGMTPMIIAITAMVIIALVLCDI